MSKVNVREIWRGTHGLDLSGVNGDDPDASRNELFPQALCEAANSSLGSTVDGATDIGLTACAGIISILLIMYR